MSETTLNPTPLRQPVLLYCRECGAPFWRGRSDQMFCAPRCTKTHHSRRMLGGIKLYDAAMAWRIDRPQGAMSELQAIVDDLAHDERERRRKRKERIAEHQASLGRKRSEMPPR